MADKDYYKILGLKRDASNEEIYGAYRMLARQYHPDKNDAPGSVEIFKEVKEAIDILSDPQKKANYDIGSFSDRTKQQGPLESHLRKFK